MLSFGARKLSGSAIDEKSARNMHLISIIALKEKHINIYNNILEFSIFYVITNLIMCKKRDT